MTDPTTFRDLDNASLQRVLCCLTATEVLTVSQCCTQLHRASRSNLIWCGLASRDFAIAVEATPRACPTAGWQLYQQLLRGKQFCKTLPVKAVATDGGCDGDTGGYWAGNMFASSRISLYCSDAGASNIHVFGRFVPDPAAAEEDLQGSDASARHQQQQLPQLPPNLRSFLLGRCLGPASELLSPEAEAAALAAVALAGAMRAGTAAAAGGSAAEQCATTSAAARTATAASTAAGSAAAAIAASTAAEAGGPRSLWATLKAVAASSAEGSGGIRRQGQRQVQGSVDPKQVAAAAVLNNSSTTGLAEFYMLAYVAFEHQRPWSSSLFKGLTSDAELQSVHSTMFTLWADRMANNRHDNLRLHTTAPYQQQQQQPQRPQRKLLCDKDELIQLGRGLSALRNTCLIHEVVLSRGNTQVATCPLLSGFIFSGCCIQQHDNHHHHQQQQQQQQQAAATASGDAAAAALGGLTQQPWVASSNNLTSAAAVFAAVEAGLLPRVLRYETGAAAAYIEFEQPTPQQLQQQQQVLQQQQQQCKASASSSTGGCSSGGSGGGGSALESMVLAPALWFRFHSAVDLEEMQDQQLQQQHEQQQDQPQQQQNQQPGQAGAAVGAGVAGQHDEFADELEMVLNIPLLGADLLDVMHQQGQGQQQGGAGAGGGNGEDDGSDGELEWEEASEEFVEVEEEEQVVNQQAGGGGVAAAAAGAAAAGAAGPAGPAHPSSSSSGDGGAEVAAAGSSGGHHGAAAVIHPHDAAVAAAATAAPVAARLPAPQPAPAFPVCAVEPELPACAIEVSTGLGWRPTHNPRHSMMLNVELSLPRLASLVCVKLLDSEDRSPEFNASRGGCNIDCELALFRGQDLADLPPGLSVAGLLR